MSRQCDSSINRLLKKVISGFSFLLTGNAKKAPEMNILQVLRVYWRASWSNNHIQLSHVGELNKIKIYSSSLRTF